MKKNLFMVAAVALVALISCNKETDSPVQPAPVSDIKFEAEFVNEQTKTSLGEADKEGYRNVTWDLGEQVYINGSLFTATGLKEDGKAIFETEDLDFATAEKYDAIYPASAGKSLEAVTIPTAQDGTFANAAIAVAQSGNRSLAFMNVASLLRFQVPAAYSSVTIESTANLAGAVPVSFNEDGVPVIGEVTNASKKITLENVKADVDYYVAVLPGDHKFTFRFDGYLSKASNTTLSPARAQIFNLGVLPLPKQSAKYGLVGTMQPKEWTETAPIAMYQDTDNNVVVKKLKLYKDDRFKIVENKSWAVNHGDENGNDMKITKNGLFDIEFNTSTNKINVKCIEEYNDIKVTVTINVDRPWSEVRIHLWNEKGDNDENITTWPGFKLGTKQGAYTYEIDGKYIGSEIGYIIHNNSEDKTNDQFITLSSRKENTMNVSAYDVYFIPSSNWKQSNAWFAIYCWGSNGDAWSKMSKVNATTYGAYLPDGYAKGCDMKFVRMSNANIEELSWGNKWNESSNTKCPTDGNNCYTLKDSGWDDQGGSWKKL